MDFTPEQQEAIDRMADFICNGVAEGRRQFVLHGLAGTGKTTVLSEVARHYRLPLCTLTGKAASVLRKKSGLNATTLHSAFYDLVDRDVDSLGRDVLEFEARYTAPDRRWRDRVLALDECSMLNDSHAKDMLVAGTRIIACGDPGQLPPIDGEQYFNRPDFTLREIHRQALDSPIIRQAHRVRAGYEYEDDGPNFRVVESLATDEWLAPDSIVICFTNATRRNMTKLLREKLGLARRYPQAGEPIMCLRNFYEVPVFNGAIYTLAQDIREGDRDIYILRDGEKVCVPDARFECMPLAFGGEENTKFDFGYVITCHKAQGSEWRNVILLDEYPHHFDQRRAWVYTAITRSSEKICVIRR